MPVVLAIEPDARQAVTLRRVVRERARAEITVVDSKDAAITAIGAHLPDLILFTTLLSPRDEEDLIAHLRTLDGADHLQTLTIPLLASASDDDRGGRGFLRKLTGRKKDRGQDNGCDPWTYANEVAGYLRAAAEVKADHEWQAQRRARAPQPEAPSDVPPVQVAPADEMWSTPEIDIVVPEPPPLSDVAPQSASEAPAPDTIPVWEWPSYEPEPEAAVAEQASAAIHIDETATAPREGEAPEGGTEPVLEPWQWTRSESVEPTTEPIYLTSPDRVFDQGPSATASLRESLREELVQDSSVDDVERLETAAIPPVVYRPLKRLPSVGDWARVAEPILVIEPTPELPAESETAGVLARLRVPGHNLPVSYPHRPRIRFVRAA